MAVSSVIKRPDNIFSRTMGSWKANVDADDYTTPGVYGFSTGCSNVPEGWAWVIVLRPIAGSDMCRQIGFGAVKVYTREYRNSAWQPWKELTNA